MKKIWKRIGSGIAAVACTFSMLGTNLPNIIEANAASGIYYRALSKTAATNTESTLSQYVLYNNANYSDPALTLKVYSSNGNTLLSTQTVSAFCTNFKVASSGKYTTTDSNPFAQASNHTSNADNAEKKELLGLVGYFGYPYNQGILNSDGKTLSGMNGSMYDASQVLVWEIAHGNRQFSDFALVHGEDHWGCNPYGYSDATSIHNELHNNAANASEYSQLTANGRAAYDKIVAKIQQYMKIRNTDKDSRGKQLGKPYWDNATANLKYNFSTGKYTVTFYDYNYVTDVENASKIFYPVKYTINTLKPISGLTVDTSKVTIKDPRTNKNVTATKTVLTSTKPIYDKTITFTVDENYLASSNGSPYNKTIENTGLSNWLSYIPSDTPNSAQWFAQNVSVTNRSATLKIDTVDTHQVNITKSFKNTNGVELTGSTTTSSGSKTRANLLAASNDYYFRIKEKTSGKYIAFDSNNKFNGTSTNGTKLYIDSSTGKFTVNLPDGRYVLEETIPNGTIAGVKFNPIEDTTFTVSGSNVTENAMNEEEFTSSDITGSIKKYWVPLQSDSRVKTSDMASLTTPDGAIIDRSSVLSNTYFIAYVMIDGVKNYLKFTTPNSKNTYTTATYTTGGTIYINMSGITSDRTSATKIYANTEKFINNNGFSISIKNAVYNPAAISKELKITNNTLYIEEVLPSNVQWISTGTNNNNVVVINKNGSKIITNNERYFKFKTTKVDKNNHSIVIPGAVYGLYDNNLTAVGSDDILLETATTTETGELIFDSKLELPTTGANRYYFREITCPKEYTLDTTNHYINSSYFWGMYMGHSSIYNEVTGNICNDESISNAVNTTFGAGAMVNGYYTVFDASSNSGHKLIDEEARRTKLHAVKLDSFGNPVPNVEFALRAIDVSYNDTYRIRPGTIIDGNGNYSTDTTQGNYTKITDSNIVKSSTTGEVTWNNLYPGTYQIIERKNPNDGFVVLPASTVVENIEITLDDDITVVDSTPNEVTLYNEIQKGELTIVKQGVNGEKLKGAEFDIKLTEDFVFNGHVVQEAGTIFHCTTGSDGKAYSYKVDPKTGNEVRYPLYVGANYQIVETKAPDGYKLATAPTALVFAPDTTTNLEYVKVTKTINNTLDPISVKIIKVDGTNPTKKLPGAAFAIYADEDLTAYKKVNGNWVAQSFAKGNKIENTLDNNKFTDSNGELEFSYSFPKGSKVYIKETQEPEGGYILDPTPYHTTVSSNTATFTVTRTNDFKLVQVQVNKKYKNLITGAETNIAVNGATFTLYANDTVIIGDKTYTKDQVIEDNIQSVNGKATFTTNLPVNHSYYVLEKTAPKNYVKSDEKKVITINETDPDVVNGGNYVLRSVDIYNTTKTAEVTVVKQRLNNNGTTTGVYDKTLEGAKFKLVAAEQIKLPDGTIFAENGADIEEVTIATVTEGSNKVAKATFTKKIPTGFKYTLKETKEPNGYIKSNYTTTFTATDNQGAGVAYVPITQTVGNKPIPVSFSKKNATDNSELPGASIEVRDSTGAIAKTIDGTPISWISDGTVHTVSGITPGDYTMVETASPSGFDIATSIRFHVNADGTVTSSDVTVQSAAGIPLIVMIDGATGVQIIKQDADTNAALAGAKFQIRDKETNAIVVSEWTNPAGGKIISGVLVVGKTYILEETQAPAGYLKASPKEFTVTNTSNVQTVAMTDKPIPLQVSKRKLTDNNELAGAHLEIQNTSGTVVKNVYGTSLSWISNGSDHLIKGIPAGSYKLVETAAPEGYTIQTSIPFTIDANGNVTSSTPNTVTMKNDIPLIVMLDGVTGVSVIKKDANTNANLAGAKFQIRDKATNAIVVSEWTNPVGGRVISGVLVVGKTYILEETVAPAGYLKASPKEFTVTNSTSVQTVTMTDKPIPLQISKRKLVDNSELAGASLEIRRANGTIAYDAYGNMLSWTSNGTDHLVNGIIAGDYILVETAAPSGYVIQTSIPFTVATDGSVTSSTPNTVTMKNNIPLIVMLDDVTKVRVIKKDIGTNLPIENARLQIRDKATNTIVVPAWNNSKSGKVIEGVLVVGRTYILEELTPPPGYVKARNVEFTVTQTAEIQEVEMKDDYTKVQISKRDITTGEEIAGATLIITDSNGNEVARWVTNGSAHEIDRLPAGKYTLTEIVAPDGYALSESVEFTVTETGEIQTVTMHDQRLTELPTAGGIGTTLFAIAGFGLMSIALFFIIRRKED